MIIIGHILVMLYYLHLAFVGRLNVANLMSLHPAAFINSLELNGNTWFWETFVAQIIDAILLNDNMRLLDKSMETYLLLHSTLKIMGTTIKLTRPFVGWSKWQYTNFGNTSQEGHSNND